MGQVGSDNWVYASLRDVRVSHKRWLVNRALARAGMGVHLPGVSGWPAAKDLARRGSFCYLSLRRSGGWWYTSGHHREGED
jgi:hypothetical protein